MWPSDATAAPRLRSLVFPQGPYLEEQLPKLLVTLSQVAGETREELGDESNKNSALRSIANTMAFVQERFAELHLGGQLSNPNDLRDRLNKIRDGVQQIVSLNSEDVANQGSGGTLPFIFRRFSSPHPDLNNCNWQCSCGMK